MLRLCCKRHRFLTRLHYCAADPSNGGKAQQWGEHEVDHILFMRADVDVDANPEEVSAHRWVASQGAQLRTSSYSIHVADFTSMLSACMPFTRSVTLLHTPALHANQRTCDAGM